MVAVSMKDVQARRDNGGHIVEYTQDKLDLSKSPAVESAVPAGAALLRAPLGVTVWSAQSLRPFRGFNQRRRQWNPMT